MKVKRKTNHGIGKHAGEKFHPNQGINPSKGKKKRIKTDGDRDSTNVELAEQGDHKMLEAENVRLFQPSHPSCLYTKQYLSFRAQ